jgi:hypothetical protein
MSSVEVMFRSTLGADADVPRKQTSNMQLHQFPYVGQRAPSFESDRREFLGADAVSDPFQCLLAYQDLISLGFFLEPIG